MKTKRLAKIAAAGVGIAVVGFGFFTFYTVSQGDYYQNEIGSDLRRRLHFDVGSPNLYIGGEIREVVTLHPEAGSFFSEAGVADGDIVLSHNITNFYRVLSESRGARFSFVVAPGGDGEPLENRPKRTISLTLPAAP